MRDEELSAIEAAAWLYMDGMYACDAEMLNKAFHPTARIQGYRGKEFRSLSRDQFVSYAAGLGPREAAGEPFDMRIISIDRAGLVAVVKIAMHWNGRSYVDFLSMIRRDEGEWSISEKTAYSPT
jgi:hypothetical protein